MDSNNFIQVQPPVRQPRKQAHPKPFDSHAVIEPHLAAIPSNSRASSSVDSRSYMCTAGRTKFPNMKKKTCYQKKPEFGTTCSSVTSFPTKRVQPPKPTLPIGKATASYKGGTLNESSHSTIALNQTQASSEILDKTGMDAADSVSAALNIDPHPMPPARKNRDNEPHHPHREKPALSQSKVLDSSFSSTSFNLPITQNENNAPNVHNQQQQRGRVVIPTKRTLNQRMRDQKILTSRIVPRKPKCPSSMNLSQSKNRALSSRSIASSSRTRKAKQTNPAVQAKLNKFRQHRKDFEAGKCKTRMLAVDISHLGNAIYNAEYAQDCQAEMFRAEKEEVVDLRLGIQLSKYYASPNCLKDQIEINSKMRKIMIDWMVEVQQRFVLSDRTLFLSINILDRFTEKSCLPPEGFFGKDRLNPSKEDEALIKTYRPVIERRKYQLVGVTSMLIASKYEEIYPPYAKDFNYITSHAYTEDEIFKKEVEILTTLNFELSMPTQADFTQRFLAIVNHSMSTTSDTVKLQLKHLVEYLLELALIEVEMNKWKPSLQTAAAIFLAKRLLKLSPDFGLLPLKDCDVRSCAKDLCAILTQSDDKRYFGALYRKYSTPKKMEVSLIYEKLKAQANRK